MKKNIVMLATLALMTFVGSTTVHALSTQVINLGDQTIEQAQTGYSGTNLENLGYWFQKNGITNEDGSSIDPIADQKQDELFYTNVKRQYEVEFLGIGYAGYHSPFGVFTYGGNPYDKFDAKLMTYNAPLFVQNEVSANLKFQFEIQADTYFGFYLDSNKSGNKVSTMIAANSDSFDHVLFFDTNKGYTMSFEDIIGGGDKDWEDLVVNFKPNDGSDFTTSSTSTPEPSTMLLLGLGVLGLLGMNKRNPMK